MERRSQIFRIRRCYPETNATTAATPFLLTGEGEPEPATQQKLGSRRWHQGRRKLAELVVQKSACTICPGFRPRMVARLFEWKEEALPASVSGLVRFRYNSFCGENEGEGGAVGEYDDEEDGDE